MKKFRYFLGGMLVFLCLFGSCSDGTDPGGSTPLEEEIIEEETKDPSKDESEDEKKEDDKKEDETEEDDTEDIEDPSEEIPPAPIFLYCKAVSDKEIVFGFSQPVTMVELSFSNEQEQEITLEHEKSGKGKIITVSLEENLETDRVLTANFQAEDGYGNSISKQVLFSSTSTHAPALQINELRIDYSGSSSKAEYIEFKMLSNGNLDKLCVFAVSNGKSSLIYTFKSVEVKEGEYVVLHLRTLEELCKDEYGKKLDESGGTDSCPTARDIWKPGKDKLLHKTEAVYVLDQNGEVLDAVMITDKPDLLWSKDFIDAAEFLFKKGTWKSPAGMVCSPADAVNSANTTATRSISRNEGAENTHTKADWYVTATSGASPGLPNK